jgi:hypothetical protein
MVRVLQEARVSGHRADQQAQVGDRFSARKAAIPVVDAQGQIWPLCWTAGSNPDGLTWRLLSIKRPSAARRVLAIFAGNGSGHQSWLGTQAKSRELCADVLPGLIAAKSPRSPASHRPTGRQSFIVPVSTSFREVQTWHNRHVEQTVRAPAFEIVIVLSDSSTLRLA